MFTKETVRYICEKVLKDSALDVFYIIFNHKIGISKIAILKEYQRHQDVEEGSKKFRYTVDEAVALLIGTTFVDFYPDGTSLKYHLTDHGEMAAEALGDLLENNPALLEESKVVKKIMGGE
ncbi:hypothetical protein [Brevibacillus reuszeri]|uniref:hypothetical protein n=1 Tax=Brevibacillus reuszeri TaxID=54915 RepID=UPI000CCC897D|nr:hypothetical protein [Brevibacillus reuszeri]